VNLKFASLKKILFLGYNDKETKIIKELRKKGNIVINTSKKINSFSDYDLIISFGYKHIISKNLIYNPKISILNLHISYLPWNRGAHPNFWSFYEDTPKGVTIHLIDEGIDTGAIIYQKEITFDRSEKTFESTYQRLIQEIEKLFIKNMDNLLNGDFEAKKQVGEGTFHKRNDLPDDFKGWNKDIKNEISRLKNNQ